MFWVFAILHAYTAYRSMLVRRDVAIEFVLFSLLFSSLLYRLCFQRCLQSRCIICLLFLSKFGEILKFDLGYKKFFLYLYAEILASKFAVSIFMYWTSRSVWLENLGEYIRTLYSLPINLWRNSIFPPMSETWTAYMHNRTKYPSCLYCHGRKYNEEFSEWTT